METKKSPRTVEELVRAYATPLSVIAAGALIAMTIYTGRTNSPAGAATATNQSATTLEEDVLPTEGVELPAIWDDLGAKLVASGTIDEKKFKDLYTTRGGLSAEELTLLEGKSTQKIRITRENSAFLLNLFWALGLGNKNPILESGEMTDPRYGGAGNFASTGGWTIAVGKPMDHYSKHALIVLTKEQQALVDRVSRNIYRPCCGNSTHFPDCNHGMAMLGLLELMAAQGASEQDMYKAALAVNSYWFPETYVTIATYMQNRGIAWKNVDPKEMLGSAYSSSSGYQQISAQVTKPPEVKGGNGCST